jgi:hypothetical protein
MSPFEEAFFESLKEQIDALGETSSNYVLYRALYNLRESMLRRLGLRD